MVLLMIPGLGTVLLHFPVTRDWIFSLQPFSTLVWPVERVLVSLMRFHQDPAIS